MGVRRERTQHGGGDSRLHPWVERFSSHRFRLTACFDGLMWLVALTATTWLRYEFDWAAVSVGGVVGLGLGAGATQVLLGTTQGLYQGRWRFGSFEELASVAGTVLATTAVVLLVDVAVGHPVPRGAVLLAGPIALVGMAGARYTWRLYLETLARPSHAQVRPTLVYGAGEAGHQLVRSMMTNPRSPFLPVGALDDDPRKQGHRLLRGVRVLGPGAEMTDHARATEAQVLVVAIPSAGSDRLRAIVEQAEAVGLDVRIVPPLWELADRAETSPDAAPAIAVGDVRPITMTDILGRHELDLDVASIAGYLTARSVLVTGAGGSIGSELCRQIARFAPEQLIMLDRDESGLHALQLSLDGEARVDDERLVVADIRDTDRLAEVFGRFRPQVVFHAAALKHVPLLELHPDEAFKTNVRGTRNVLEVAAAAGVDRFINISTDKAADPVNMLGRSKLLAECLTAGVAERAGGTYLSVRFGNVLGSRGSMLTTFEHQLTSGGPITVTHPEVTRYFMTIEEAVQLVIQAGAIGADGDVLVLEMGEPVRIADVARRLAESVDPPVEIRYTGLRPGEKLTEVLFTPDEEARPSAHPLIMCLTGRPLDPAAVPRVWPVDAPVGDAFQHCLDRIDGLDRPRPAEPTPAEPTDVTADDAVAAGPTGSS